jgi:hypothetical protein
MLPLELQWMQTKARVLPIQLYSTGTSPCKNQQCKHLPVFWSQRLRHVISDLRAKRADLVPPVPLGESVSKAQSDATAKQLAMGAAQCDDSNYIIAFLAFFDFRSLLCPRNLT